MSGKCLSCGGDAALTTGFHMFGCPESMNTVYVPEVVVCNCGAIIHKGDGHFCGRKQLPDSTPTEGDKK